MGSHCDLLRSNTPGRGARGAAEFGSPRGPSLSLFFHVFRKQSVKKKQNGLPVVESCVLCCNLAAFGRHGRTPALTVCKDQFAQKRNAPRVRFGIERSVSSTLVGERVFARTQIRNLTRVLLLFACAKCSRIALGASCFCCFS